MFRTNRILIVIFLLAFLFGSGLSARSVQAQEASLPLDTPVSNIGGVLAMPEAAGLSLKNDAPFAGAGLPDGAVAPTISAPESPMSPLVPTFPGSVIGADGRVQATGTTGFPNRAIVFLEVTFPNGSGTCSGWYYGPRIVATAGHCVYDAETNQWATSITVWPGRNGDSVPYGSTTGHRFFSVTGWTSSHSASYDYGAIQTDAALGNTVGWFGYRWQSSNSFPGTFTVKGFPGDKPYGTMWTMSGSMKAVSTYRLWYSIDTAGGQSGSPHYQVWGGACCYGVGIHTYGVGLSGTYPYSTYNSSTRIRQAVFNNMKSWKTWAYP